jgi:predicted Zn finger-like uncharacterized protein
MNTACPSCGAVYAVTPKDVGRKIKCKKCSTALRVDDSGLVVDTPASSPPPPAAVAAAVVDDEAEGGDEGAVIKKKGKKSVDRDRDYQGGGGRGIGVFLEKIGGMPTILFGFGTFFVLYFFFQPVLSLASLERASGLTDRVNLEKTQQERKYQEQRDKLEKDRKAEKITQKVYDDGVEEIRKAKDKFYEDLRPKEYDAFDSKGEAEITRKRSALLDSFGLMVGFILLAFGCIGYIRGDSPLVTRIVAASILTAMMLAVFAKFSGCRGG